MSNRRITAAPLWLGGLLVSTSVAALIGMAHHPELSGNGTDEVVASARYVARQSNFAHGGLIAIAVLHWLGVGEATRVLGAAGWEARAAARLWGVGTAALVGAALISGFIAPDIGTLAASGQLTTQAASDELQVSYLVNQRLSQLGVILWAVSVLLYSRELSRLAGAAKPLGWIGGGIAVIGAGALASGQLQLDLRGMTTVVAAVSGWLACLGGLVIWSHAFVAGSPIAVRNVQ